MGYENRQSRFMEMAGAWFVVTVDTEADDAWRHPERLALENMREIERFQALCERYRIRPTYLLAYECATRDEAIDVLRPIVDRNACEIGHHLHCWSTPPFEREGPSGIDSAWLNAYQYELPESLFFDKAEVLYQAIESAYGVAPTAHRAGRWGIDERTLRWLARRGFVVDSSVLPLRSMRACKGRFQSGPAFFSASRQVHFADIGGEESDALVEIPASIDVPDMFPAKACARYIGADLPAADIVARLFQSRWIGGGRRLCPDPRYPEGFLAGAVERAAGSPGRVVNLSLHSSELILNGSPFSRTPDEVERVWARLTEVFETVFRLGLRLGTLSEAALAWRVGSAGASMRTSDSVTYSTIR